MKYEKTTGVAGGWVKAAEVVSGTKAKLVSECVPVQSVYEGQPRTQNVAKVRFQGEEGEAKNMNLNKPTINGLIDAFGSDSNAWIGKVLTAQTEKMVVGGKRVTALYLIPEGYKLGEDAGGYLVVTKEEVKKEQEEPVDEDEVNPEDIPFD